MFCSLGDSEGDMFADVDPMAETGVGQHITGDVEVSALLIDAPLKVRMKWWRRWLTRSFLGWMKH